MPETPSLGPETAPSPRDTGHHYVMRPAWDLAFVINAPWLLFAALFFLFREGVGFGFHGLQLYWLVMPHRFITFGLVFLDRDKLATRPRAFYGYFALFAGVYAVTGWLGGGQLWGSSAFLCIVLIDHFWNAYHFAAQHFGITRIYGRKAGSSRPTLERWVIIGSITYVMITAIYANFVNLAGTWKSLMLVGDLVAVGALGSLVVLELVGRVPSLPKLLYLASITLLYGGIALAPHFGSIDLWYAFVAAAGFYHSVEYFAIVTFYVGQKQRAGDWKSGFFKHAAPQWPRVLAVFLIGFGLAALAAKELTPQLYLFLMTVGSFCHYAYDGMIWKLRKPGVSAALKAEASS